MYLLGKESFAKRCVLNSFPKKGPKTIWKKKRIKWEALWKPSPQWLSPSPTLWNLGVKCERWHTLGNIYLDPGPPQHGNKPHARRNSWVMVLRRHGLWEQSQPAPILEPVSSALCLGPTRTRPLRKELLSSLPHPFLWGRSVDHQCCFREIPLQGNYLRETDGSNSLPPNMSERRREIW